MFTVLEYVLRPVLRQSSEDIHSIYIMSCILCTYTSDYLLISLSHIGDTSSFLSCNGRGDFGNDRLKNFFSNES